MTLEKEEQISDLKRRAILLRESGDTNGAMTLLAQARDLVFENASIDDFWEPIKLKQLAIVLKKKGDLDGARHALVKAKQMEKEGAVPQPQQLQQHTKSEPKQAMFTVEEHAQNDPDSTSLEEKCRDGGSKEIFDEAGMETPVSTSSESEMDNDRVNYNDDDDDDDDDGDGEQLKELMQLGQTHDDNNNLVTDVSFSVHEMADQEMMAEFKLGGMPVPTDEEYQAKILECKKSALAFKKAGDTAQALQELQNSKLLENVRFALSQMNEGRELPMNEVEDVWTENLNNEESELLGADFDKKHSNPNGQSTSGNSNPMGNVLEYLEAFMEDPCLFMDAIAMGMEVPSVEDVLAKAEEKKTMAVEHKKAGNLEGAKSSLLQFKQLTALASKLEHVLEQMEQKNKNGSSNTDGSNVKIEDLQALVDTDEGKKSKQPSKDATQEMVKKEASPAVISSEALKQEIIQLRDQKKIKEAGEVLKMYKDALKREQQEAELQQRQEIVNELRKEIEYAEQQVRMFEFYERLVDADAQQISAWKEYIAKCSNASKVIQAKGSGSIKISRKQGNLMCAKLKQTDQEEQNFNDIVTGLLQLGSNADPPDERLEIAIIDLQKIQENDNLQKLLKQQKREHLPQHPSTIKVDVHVQIPPNEHDTGKSIELVYGPSEDPLKRLQLTTGSEQDSQLPSTCEIGKSQHLDLPRDNSPYGKIIRRRIERNKKIQISVYRVPVTPKKGGWFWSKNKGDEDLPPPTLLGKVVLELQGLLTKKCAAAGEFPLMNGSGTKELGGTIRLAIRTGLPWAQPEAANSGADGAPHTELVPHNAMLFSINQLPTAEEI